MTKKKKSVKDRVLEFLTKIPKGKIVTYKDIAKKLGVENGSRAIGRILNSNQEPKTFPCYKVVKSDGSLGGYSGGTKRKMSLLKHDGMVWQA